MTSAGNRPLKVFLCHSSQDKPIVNELYDRLLGEGWIDPWLDKERLKLGDDFDLEIEKAIESTDAVIAFISENAVKKTGYIQKELRLVYDAQMYRPDGELFTIPLRLEDCEPPRRFKYWHWGNYFDEEKEKTYQSLLDSLRLIHERVQRNEVIEQAQQEADEKEEQQRIAKEKAEHEAAEKFAREKAKKEADERARLRAEKEEQQRIAKEKAEREAAEKFVREKAKKEADERARLKLEEEERKRIAKEKAEREAAEIAIREKIAKEKARLQAGEEERKRIAKRKVVRRISIGGVIIGSLFLAMIGSNTFIKRLEVMVTETTSAITSTSIVSSPTTAVAPTSIPGAGLTMISDDAMVMVYVPEGEFTMGSENNNYPDDERPQHKIYLNAFWIDQTEVANLMYKKCVLASICAEPRETLEFDKSDFGNYPVTDVDWEQSKIYCEWAGRRLPTEAEWEKAARGPDGNQYPWGNNDPGEGYSNYNNILGRIAEVGSYPSGVSIYGALDMAGNVSEWVSDLYSEGYYQTSPSSNPLSDTGLGYVIRGGSFVSNIYYIRSANREYLISGRYDTGFRCAMDATP